MSDNPVQVTVVLDKPVEAKGVGVSGAAPVHAGRPIRLGGLPDKQVKELLKVRWEKARRDPLYFLKTFCFTLDQHDKATPIKAIPSDRPHLRILTELWVDNRCLVICKSRQMLCTWLFCALSLWDAMFHRGRLIMLQSKREDDAIGNRVAGDGLLGRVGFILDHVPGGKIVLPENKSTYNRIEFPTMNSTIWSIPQGSDIIRQRTASGILSDEAAFQEQFNEAYTAARPCIRGGGWFVALSTPHPGFFQELYQDAINPYG